MLVAEHTHITCIYDVHTCYVARTTESHRCTVCGMSGTNPTTEPRKIILCSIESYQIIRRIQNTADNWHQLSPIVNMLTNINLIRERHLLASICVSRSQKPRKQNSRKVKRLFTGFQTNFVDVSTNMAKYGTEVADRSRDSGRRSRDRRPTVKQRSLDVSSK